MTTDVPVSSDVENEPGIAQPENYAFVMNVWHLTDAACYTLAPGHELRRATAEEITVIKNIIRNPDSPFLPPRYQHLWEHRWPHPGGNIEYLAESEWRYFVIAFRGLNSTLRQLEIAFDLALLELEVAFTVLTDLGGTAGRGVIWNENRLFHVLNDDSHSHSFFRDVSASDIEAIQGIYAQLQNHDHRVVDITRQITQLGQLKGLPHSSPLRFLGYFALLESLLTHKPKPSDPYDSITRQVKKKLALLDHRWPQPLDYSPFKGTLTDKIWSVMYDYRSLVAHGGTPAFTGKLAILRNHDTALILLKEAVKAVIRQALAEPQLLLDLREC